MTNLLFFDDRCVLCNKAVQWIYRKDKKQKFTFVALQSDFAQEKLKKFSLKLPPEQSFIMMQDGRVFQQSSAAIKVVKMLPFPWFLGVVFWIIPSWIRNKVYAYIASNRLKWFGKQQGCLLVNDENRHRFVL
ncbi:MAG: DUF393 domain-containing protein [Bacteroidetes bacterium]|nr:DUF393 domain-containing protein [Bacteroidota bacterium]